MRGAAAALVAVAAAACGGNHAPRGDAPLPAAGSGAGAATDSVRGVVRVTGADPLTRVELRTAAGEGMTVRGAEALRGAAGLEVVIHGARTAAAIEATSFRVVALDGTPAADGRLVLEGDAAVLVTAAGERLRYPAAPAALRALAGRHVWVAGEPGREPRQWGTLDG